MKRYLLLIFLFLSFAPVASYAQSSSVEFADDVDDLGVKPGTNNKISVFPNPTSDNITVALSSYKEQKVVVTVVNSTGKTVAYKSAEDCKKTSTVAFNLSKFGKGVYFIKITTPAKSEIVGKVLVQG